MSSNRLEIAVGAVVLAAAIGFGIYAAQVAGVRAGGDSYPLTASFRSLEGISVGSDVRLAGVKVGTVTQIALNPDTYRATTTVAIDAAVAIPDDSAIVISSEGLLGGSFVEINPGGSPFFYASGDEIADTQGSVSLVTLLLRFVGGEGQ
ncbi:MAG: outer membrane lipid asymmetry maintenance protein MlaD [Pseudomonadota bacterium]